jgi:hypothetical protein
MREDEKCRWAMVHISVFKLLGSFAWRKLGAAQLEVFLMGIEARVTWLMAVGSMWRWTDGCST